MTHEAVLKFAPIFTRDRFDDPAWAGRLMVDSATALRFMTGKTTIPLLIDHLEDEPAIGTVHSLFRMEWTDGPWVAASARIDRKPDWLKRGTRASFEHRDYDRRTIAIRDKRADIIAGSVISEISVLSPGTRPAEPLAEVLSLRAATPEPVGEIIHTGRQLVRRYYQTPIVIR